MTPLLATTLIGVLGPCFRKVFRLAAFSFCLTVGLHSGAVAAVSSAAPSATEIPAPELVASARNVHPRLVFGPDDLPRLKAFYASERGRVFREALEKYLPKCIPPTHTEFLDGKDPDTDAQRQFFWRLPTAKSYFI